MCALPGLKFYEGGGAASWVAALLSGAPQQSSSLRKAMHAVLHEMRPGKSVALLHVSHGIWSPFIPNCHLNDPDSFSYTEKPKPGKVVSWLSSQIELWHDVGRQPFIYGSIYPSAPHHIGCPLVCLIYLPWLVYSKLGFFPSNWLLHPSVSSVTELPSSLSSLLPACLLGSLPPRLGVLVTMSVLQRTWWRSCSALNIHCWEWLSPLDLLDE